MKITVAIIVVAATFVATALTACVERPVLSAEQMRAHRTGYPFAFAVQDLSQRYNPLTFPQHFGFSSPGEVPTKLDLEPFLASWAIILGVGALVIWFASRAWKPHTT